jgi:hypothetical protein
MKKQVNKLLIGGILFALCLMLSQPALADKKNNFPFPHDGTYTVKAGDNLWNISKEKLGNPWCWVLIASEPENKVDYQGPLFIDKVLKLPKKQACLDIIDPVRLNIPLKSKQKLSEKTSISNSTESSIAKLMQEVRDFHQDDTEKTSLKTMLNSAQNIYDNMKDFDPNEPHRIRNEDLWYVVVDGEKSKAWDYVDKIRKNQSTGSIFYRARDIRGKWYIVKNDKAQKLSFEPSRLYLNESIDDFIALDYIFPKYHPTPFKREVVGLSTNIASSNKEWKIPGDARPISTDSKGNTLFKATTRYDVRTVDENGKIFEVCSSAVCSLDHTYWLNDSEIGVSTERMVPLFSKNKAAYPLPFFYEGEQKAMKYYGVFIEPSFNTHNQLVFYVLFNNTLTKQVYRLK